MSVFSAHDYDGHEQVVFCSDEDSGLECIIALHNTARGPALGGCRMWDYASEDEALTDALRLSRGMTYKAAVAGLPFGGGKAVILGDSRTRKSVALLRAYGRFVDSLGGRYITAEDVGTTVEDMDVVRETTRFARGLSDGTGNPSPATAYGVFLAIRAAVEHKMGTSDLSGLRVAVQGLGNVGYRLSAYLAEAGARLFVTDVRPEAVRRATRDFAAVAVSGFEIYGLDVDVFAPCALGAVINDETVPILGAAIVAGAANNQLALDRHGEALRRRGILYVPDYVANAGGLMDIAYEDSENIMEKVGGIHGTLKLIFARAEVQGIATNTVADRMAEDMLMAGAPIAA